MQHSFSHTTDRYDLFSSYVNYSLLLKTQETPTAAEEKPATTEASAVTCFVVCVIQLLHLHSMLQETIPEPCPQAGSPAEPSATGAATDETTPAAAIEQPQEPRNEYLTSFAVFCTQSTQRSFSHTTKNQKMIFTFHYCIS